MTRKAVGWLLPLLLLVALSGCRGQNGTRVLKLAHGLEVAHPVHRAMVHMADRLSELSGGRMRVDIYPGGQLGEERELIEMLQIGSLAMTKVSASPLESFVPEMTIFSIPYVFRDQDHLWRVLDGEIGRRLLLTGQRYYLRGLCYYDAGPRSFYTRGTPIRTPEDLRGLKIRVQKSITSTRMVQVLGGAATPIDWGELYSALQQGVVDGAENNPPSFFLSRHYEVSRYYTLDEHTWVPDILLISTRVWTDLSPQEREWLTAAVAVSVAEQRRLWREASQQALAQVRAAGVEIIEPDKSAFREAVRPMHDSYRGSSVYDLLRAIERIR
ncbi:MAG: TRAP transporter substrate-binding protein [Gemmatimonadales bacterium]|jgi:tripartite ATP-independent transporter DctP family solute receptor